VLVLVIRDIILLRSDGDVERFATHLSFLSVRSLSRAQKKRERRALDMSRAENNRALRKTP
jgi:hypothetical protein